jgi:hypothetical protein
MTKLIPFSFEVPGNVMCCPSADLAAILVEGVELSTVAMQNFTVENVPQPYYFQ